MNALIEWWARNSVAANLLMIGIFVSGVIGFTSMEREMDPQVRFPGLEINVSWPGAAPQEVEEQIVARIWTRSSGFGRLPPRATAVFTSWPSSRSISRSS
jgi:multidrug efflux pump subunit AcrB